MVNATGDNTKRKRATQTGTLIGVRVQPNQLAALDAWIERTNGELSRPEAIRLILKDALPDPNTTSVRREFDKAGGA